MKILHVTFSMDPARGGPPVVVSRVAAAQADLGHEVRVFSGFTPGTDAAIAKSLSTVPGIEPVKFFSVQIPEKFTAAFFRQSWEEKLVEQIKWADFVHIHEVWGIVNLKAGQLAHALGRPYCVTPHGVLSTWGMAQKSRKKKLALALGWKKLLDRASFVHYLNAIEQSQVQPLNIRARGVEIPNGVFESEVFPLPAQGTYRTSVNGLGDARYVLFLSRLHFKKGLDILADAFAIVARADANVHLVIAGPDDGEKAPTEAKLANAGLSSRVHFVGPVYGKQKFAAYVDAELFVLPSRMEGFSMAITEAMVCKTPVVITEECAFPEVQTAGCGVVTPLDAQKFAQGMLDLLTDPSRRAACAQRAQELILKKYTWPKIAQAFTKAYFEAKPGTGGR